MVLSLGGVIELLQGYPPVVVLVDDPHDLLDLLHSELLVGQLDLRLGHLPVPILHQPGHRDSSQVVVAFLGKMAATL